MANSLISYNQTRAPRALTPLPAKGPRDIAIVQVADLDAEAGFIAERIYELMVNDVHPNEIIVLVQRSIAAKPILTALKAKGVPAKSYYEESQLDSAAAQKRFALFKLFLNNEDKVALRYLVGVGSSNYRAKRYARLRGHCEPTGESPWATLEKLEAGALNLPYTAPLVKAFSQVKAELAKLHLVETDASAFIDALFPDGDDALSELRALALQEAEDATTPKELLDAVMDEITQPDVPLIVEDVRIMSLHKSKGLSSPYVFIAGCVQGILPPLPDPSLPQAAKTAQMEESRRLFYVGITRVKADPAEARPGTLIISYPQQMLAAQAFGANIAFASQSGATANLIPSRFIGELGPSAPIPQKGREYPFQTPPR